ncbi:hypothetical protein DAPPUDRAFT_233546 [Daphnia pulex]|uniref:Uncharacterized protein n=1 Tax=Daphnia pulex TaxID=6669 RepID=E9FV32_DAPPU|nr:hypothetical protein DAPPUDRAFT_233546 [Daphnia pulex]|eukprot:EFX89177.1 hypothetical protein DAPPUDRAFT_233546 [Daphnia pulex]
MLNSRMNKVGQVTQELSPLSVPAAQQLFPALAHLTQINDYDILASACMGLFFYLTNGPNEKILEVVDAGVVPLLVTLLDHN